LAIPLFLVNGAAVWGQGGWAYEHITKGGQAGILIAILFAVAVESIGAYLAWESHEARMSDRAYLGLQLSSYAVGAFAGWLNYQHFVNTNSTQAVTFGVLSALSPWLWGVYSRAQNTERLDALGMVDARGVKLSSARKFWHPGRSVAVMRHAAWEGITRPMEAIDSWEQGEDPQAYARRVERRNAAAVPAAAPAAAVEQLGDDTPALLPRVTVPPDALTPAVVSASPVVTPLASAGDKQSQWNPHHPPGRVHHSPTAAVPGHSVSQRRPAPQQAKSPATGRRSSAETLRLIRAVQARNPDATQDQIGAELQISARRVRQVIAAISA
jgi:hypothetical protein